MDHHVSIGRVCILLGISLSTAYRWIKAGTLVPAFITSGGHRRFSVQDLQRRFFPHHDGPKAVVTYARVSSADQKTDLDVQNEKLKAYVRANFPGRETIHLTDLGSGLNFRKKGLNQLLRLIWNRQIDTLIINHKDRLLRFGAELVFKLCTYCNVEVIIVEKSEDRTFEQELAHDVIELMTVFCARLCGRRSHKNKCISG